VRELAADVVLHGYPPSDPRTPPNPDPRDLTVPRVTVAAFLAAVAWRQGEAAWAPLLKWAHDEGEAWPEKLQEAFKKANEVRQQTKEGRQTRLWRFGARGEHARISSNNSIYSDILHTRVFPTSSPRFCVPSPSSPPRTWRRPCRGGRPPRSRCKRAC
jgi:hypothetical protein